MRPFSIGVIVDSFRKSLPEGVALAKQLGIQGVQMYMVRGELAPERLNAKKIEDIRTIMRDNDMEISAVCGDLGGYGFEKHADNKDKIKRSKVIMDAASALEVKVVTTHIGVIPADPEHERYRIMQEACYELGNYAESKGMAFAIETGPEKAVVLKGFLDSLNCKGMKVNFDPANFVMVSGQDPVEAVHLLKDEIVHTHAKDGRMIQQADPKFIYDIFAQGGIEDVDLQDYFIETPLGEGAVDFDAYLQALEEIGYQGYLTIEREVGDDPYRDIELAVELLKSKI